jgi:hypothetical protein
MNYVLKLKTGFYKTTLCQISIQSNCINLIPLNSEMKDPILFTSSDLVSLHLIKDKHSEIEIKTRDQTLSGIFEENQDLKKIHQELKRQINTRITYEEE